MYSCTRRSWAIVCIALSVTIPQVFTAEPNATPTPTLTPTTVPSWAQIPAPTPAPSAGLPIACGDFVVGSTVGASDGYGFHYGDTAGDILYELNFTKNTWIEVDMCNGTDFNSVIRIYKVPLPGILNIIHSDDDGCGDTAGASTVAGSVSSGTTSILVDGIGSSEGTYHLSLTCLDLVCHDVPLAGTQVAVTEIDFNVRVWRNGVYLQSFDIIPASNFKSNVVNVYRTSDNSTARRDSTWTLISRIPVYNGSAGVKIPLDLTMNFFVPSSGAEVRGLRISLDSGELLATQGTSDFHVEKPVPYFTVQEPYNADTRFAGSVCWSYAEVEQSTSQSEELPTFASTPILTSEPTPTTNP